MIAGTLLAVVKAPEQLDAALRAYDQVQMFIVESSRITGQIMTGQGAGFGVDIEKIKEALASRWPSLMVLILRSTRPGAPEEH